MSALTVATWRAWWQLTAGEATEIELATRKSGCVSEDDDRGLAVMESESWVSFLPHPVGLAMAVSEEERAFPIVRKSRVQVALWMSLSALGRGKE
ncbi:hypothetical protein HD554DRAFT_2105126 [Boletus coccyginus]|nr:hypothetical protein HD554DRAFT_2105126 [Boletus coccyginus]